MTIFRKDKCRRLNSGRHLGMHLAIQAIQFTPRSTPPRSTRARLALRAPARLRLYQSAQDPPDMRATAQKLTSREGPPIYCMYHAKRVRCLLCPRPFRPPPFLSVNAASLEKELEAKATRAQAQAAELERALEAREDEQRRLALRHEEAVAAAVAKAVAAEQARQAAGMSIAKSALKVRACVRACADPWLSVVFRDVACHSSVDGSGPFFFECPSF